MNKCLLITGASSDVGMSLLKKVYKNYSLIYVQYRNMQDSFDKLIKECSRDVEIVPLKADLSSDEEITEMIEKIKEKAIIPDEIVHLPAPKAYNKQFHKDKPENFDAGWQIGVKSAVLILKEFLPKMAKNNYGRVIFMLTGYTVNNPPKFQSAYVTAKYALLGLMKSLAVEYADKGITVNGISPEMMETKFLSDIPELIVEQNKESMPIGRNIKVEEIIPVMEYMLSENGAAMTGQNIVISGGK